MTVTVWPIATVTGAPAYSGRMLRQAQSVFLAGATSARPLGATSGVRPGTSTTTCTATSTTWTIGPHAGVMDVEVAAECGAYTYANDAVITGAMTAAHATLARVDILWMRVDDPPEDGTSVPAVVGGYTAGTAASTPAAPATPARCMVLGWVNVPASGGGSPTVIWVAPYTVAAGAPTPVWSAADRDAKFPVPYDGLQVYRLDTHRVEVYNGTSWASASPVGGVFSGACSTTGYVTIAHGLGYVPTRLTYAVGTYDANSIILGVTISSIDATNIILHVSNLATNIWLAAATSMNIYWTAQ